MLIEYSAHSLSKIEILKNHGINISKELIENTINTHIIQKQEIKN